MTCLTLSDLRAARLALYGTLCGGSVCLLPCRGRKAIRLPPNSPMLTGEEGDPYGVEISLQSEISNPGRVHRPEPPITPMRGLPSPEISSLLCGKERPNELIGKFLCEGFADP